MIIIICLQGHKEKSISERNRRRERDIFSMSIVFLGDIYKQLIDKVEKILKGSPDLISSPSVKIQIIGGKAYLRQ